MDAHERNAVSKRLEQIASELTFTTLSASQVIALQVEKHSLEVRVAADSLKNSIVDPIPRIGLE